MNGGRKMSTNEQLLQEIIAKMGGVENIQSIASCMTRVRIAPITRSQVDFEGLKNTQQVLGVVDADTVQIVLGPGKAKKVADDLIEHCKLERMQTSTMDVSANSWQQNKQDVKDKQT